MSLRKELAEFKEKEKEKNEVVKGLQRENSELLSEIEGLRAQLDDALTKNHESYSTIVDYRYYNGKELCNLHTLFFQTSIVECVVTSQNKKMNSITISSIQNLLSPKRALKC